MRSQTRPGRRAGPGRSAARRLPIAAALWLLLAPPLGAQLVVPVLSGITPPGGQPGATVRATLAGKYLEPVTALYFEHPGLSAALPAPPAGEAKPPAEGGQPAPRPATLAWDITIAPDVPPGFYDVRAATAGGISAPRTFHVSPLPIIAGAESSGGRPVSAELGAWILGTTEDGEKERYTFRAPRPGRVVVEVIAERIDSPLDASIEVYGGGRRLAYSADRISHDPAAAVDAVPGVEYTVEVWDFTYRGNYPYLLGIHMAPRALFAFPPAVPAQGEAAVTVYGWNLPGGREARGAPDPLEAFEIRLPLPAGGQERAFASYRKTTGLLDEILEAPFPGDACAPLLLARSLGSGAAIESEPDDAPAAARPAAIPGDIFGRFDHPGDIDWYSFAAAKGAALEFEVQSARLDAPCDPVILIARREVQMKDGQEVEVIKDLLYVEERRGGYPGDGQIRGKIALPERDPDALWTAPDEGPFLLMVRNRNGRGGPEAIYRIAAREPVPGFDLVAIHSENYSGEGITLPRGGSQSLDLLLDRRGGFDGEVEVSAEGLPEGVSCPPVYLARGENYVPVVFIAGDAAPDWTGGVRLIGTAEWNGKPIRGSAVSAFTVVGLRENRHPFGYVQSRFSASIPIAVRPPAPFLVRLKTPDLVVPPGAKLALKAEVTRADGFQEEVQLGYQGINEQALQDDNGNRPAKATIAKDKTEQDVQLNLPNNTPYGPHTFLVYATSKAKLPVDPSDPKSKTEDRRVTFASNPVTVQVAPPMALVAATATGRIAAGGALRIPFEVKRLEGVGEVEVVLQLPGGAGGLSAAAIKLPADQGAGEILLASEVDGAPGKFEGAALRARTQFAGRQFEETVPLPYGIERIVPLKLAAGEMDRNVCRGGIVEVPFQLERAGEVQGKFTVAVSAPGNTKGLSAEPMVFEKEPPGDRLALFLGDAAAGEIAGLRLEAALEKNGKKFTVSETLPPLKVEPAFKLGKPETGRAGALRLELARHPRLRPAEEIPLRVQVIAPSGKEAVLETSLPGGQMSRGLLIDTAPLEEPGIGLPSPLQVRIAAIPEKGRFTEEHRIELRDAAAD